MVLKVKGIMRVLKVKGVLKGLFGLLVPQDLLCLHGLLCLRGHLGLKLCKGINYIGIKREYKVQRVKGSKGV